MSVCHSLKTNGFLFESNYDNTMGSFSWKSSALIPEFLLDKVLILFIFPVIDYRFIVVARGFFGWGWVGGLNSPCSFSFGMCTPTYSCWTEI